MSIRYASNVGFGPRWSSFIAAFAIGAASLTLIGCSEQADDSGEVAQADPAPAAQTPAAGDNATGSEQTPAETETAAAPPEPEPRGEVVLYTSADDRLARQIVEEFEANHNVDVRLAGDTEATKTVGLFQRLRAEADNPRADVWWSSEPFYTIRLADEQVIGGTSFSESSSWPDEFSGSDGAWYGFSTRARAIVYDTRKLSEDQVPLTLRDMAEPSWRGRIGMAKPIAGTTIGHVAAMVALWGEAPTRDLMRALHENKLRLYDGNASVVRAVAMGEIEVGLTDTDDVWAGQRNNWPVEIAYEAREFEGTLAEDSVPGLLGFGSLVMPNTVARVRGGPNEEAAALLIEFLLSEQAERSIMESDSQNVPVRADLSAELASSRPETVVPNPAVLDYELVARHLEITRDIVGDVFGY